MYDNNLVLYLALKAAIMPALSGCVDDVGFAGRNKIMICSYSFSTSCPSYWNRILPQAVFAYNCSFQNSLSQPFFLLFGRNPRLPFSTFDSQFPFFDHDPIRISKSQKNLIAAKIRLASDRLSKIGSSGKFPLQVRGLVLLKVPDAQRLL